MGGKLAKGKKEILIFISAVALLIGWGFLVRAFGAEQIVERLGVHNAFLLIFFIALFSGLSTLTAPSFVAALATFSVGGLDPFLLGLFAGVGLFISDSFFFYVGTKGRHLFHGAWEERRVRLENWLKGKPFWVSQLIIFLYTGFTPLPNDILMAGAAFMCLPYRRIFIPLFLGNVTLATLISLLARGGLQILG